MLRRQKHVLSQSTTPFACTLGMLLLCAVRAEIITEIIPDRAGPVISETFSLEFLAFRLIPGICLQEEQSLKITGNDK